MASSSVSPVLLGGSHTDFCGDHSKCDELVTWTKHPNVWHECHSCQMKADGYWRRQEFRSGVETEGTTMDFCLLCAEVARNHERRDRLHCIKEYRHS